MRITHATLGASVAKAKDKGRTQVYITYANQLSTGSATDEERVMLVALSPQKVLTLHLLLKLCSSSVLVT